MILTAAVFALAQAASSTPVQPHAGHMPAPATPADDTPAPPPAPAKYADRIWGAEAMRASRVRLTAEHGGARLAQLRFDLAEIGWRDGRNAYGWDAEGWYGGDIDRVVVKSDGGGSFGGNVDADVQLLFSRAIGPYFDVQAGVRQDIGPGPSRTYAAFGIEGLTPYWLEIDATGFVSDHGEVKAEITGLYDQRITQRLILQPRIDLDLSAQDSPVLGEGAGLSRIAAGLRLRYEIAREFAPYVGVRWDRSLGRSSRYARAAGDDGDSVGLVAGVRFWF